MATVPGLWPAWCCRFLGRAPALRHAWAGVCGAAGPTGAGWHWGKELSLCFTAPDAIWVKSAFQGCRLSGGICSVGPLSGHRGCGSRAEGGPVG